MNMYVEPVTWRCRKHAREWHFTPSKSFGSRSIKAFGLLQFSSVHIYDFVFILSERGGGVAAAGERVGRFNKSNKFAVHRVFGYVNQLLIDFAALSLMLKWQKIIAIEDKGVNGRNYRRETIMQEIGEMRKWQSLTLVYLIWKNAYCWFVRWTSPLWSFVIIFVIVVSRADRYREGD